MPIPLIAAAISGLSMMKGAQAEGEAAEFNAATGELNARLIEAGGAADELAMRRANVKQMGNMRAAFGASGVTTEGSPLDVMADSAAAMATDMITARFNTTLRAKGARMGADMDASRASSAKTKGALGAASVLVSAFK